MSVPGRRIKFENVPQTVSINVLSWFASELQKCYQCLCSLPNDFWSSVGIGSIICNLLDGLGFEGQMVYTITNSWWVNWVGDGRVEGLISKKKPGGDGGIVKIVSSLTYFTSSSRHVLEVWKLSQIFSWNREVDVPFSQTSVLKDLIGVCFIQIYRVR